MKAYIRKLSLLLAVIAVVAISPNSAAAVPSSSPGLGWAWGKNLHGQLGNNSTNDTPVSIAVQMPDTVTFTTISAGHENSFALDTAGKAWAWGDNGLGQLGNDSTEQSSVPVAVQMRPDVTLTAISAGYDHSLALDTAGQVWAWGSNQFGQLGNNATDMSVVPVAVRTPMNVMFTTISAGYDHSLALDTAGQVWAWGSNSYGQLGSKNTVRALVPVAVQTPANVTFTSISAGYDYSLALDAVGQVWAWGDKGFGQLGNNTTDKSPVPVAVQMPANLTIAAISAGYDHSLALDTAGLAWAWGNNRIGALGNNVGANSVTPVAVQMPASVTFTMVSAGWGHSLALDTAGHAWGWGAGPLGGSSTSMSYEQRSQVPVAVQMPPGVTFASISTGTYHTLALQAVSDL
jgi:alpha-tubulin suppressor-like RCC1 family protein